MLRKNENMKTETKTNMREGTGDIYMRHLLEAEEMDGKGRLFAHMTLPPGTSIGYHQHTGEKETYYILKGTGEWNHNGETLPFAPGDLMLTPKDGTHSITNTGSDPVEFIALILYE